MTAETEMKETIEKIVDVWKKTPDDRQDLVTASAHIGLLIGYVGRLQHDINNLKGVVQMSADAEAQFDAVTTERNRWAEKNRKLENERQFAIELLSSRFSITDIAKMREGQGLEPFPLLSEKYRTT